jgi:precorrin-2/cobalt-factor-2 C20-methyltransferase
LKNKGKFYGIGVGPGTAKTLSVAAWEALQEADVILVPRARHVKQSIAKQCLAQLELPEESFREVIYNMDPDREQIFTHYSNIARSIVEDLDQGKTVAYLTIGDSLTYSTYSYTLKALLELKPDVERKTFPGITSFAAVAAAFEWPLGQGKEKTLILPCPDDASDLRREIQANDVVVLMKIGNRMRTVINLIYEMGIAEHCAFASRIGLEGEFMRNGLLNFNEELETLGYLSTMLIRKNPAGVHNQ